jgi:hypothetical protein
LPKTFVANHDTVSISLFRRLTLTDSDQQAGRSFEVCLLTPISHLKFYSPSNVLPGSHSTVLHPHSLRHNPPPLFLRLSVRILRRSLRFLRPHSSPLHPSHIRRSHPPSSNRRPRSLRLRSPIILFRHPFLYRLHPSGSQIQKRRHRLGGDYG